jgi:hypothetical protein
VEVNATIPGAFHHLYPAIVVSFLAYSPHSSPTIYIFIILFTFINLFPRSIYITHPHFEFATILGQYSYFYRLGKTGCYTRRKEYFEYLFKWKGHLVEDASCEDEEKIHKHGKTAQELMNRSS